MLFPTGTFALFFATVFLAHWGLRRHPVANHWLLLGASLVFYAHWSLEFCALLGGLGFWAWGMGRLLATRRGNRPLLWLAIAGPLAVLGWFKYADFFLAEFGAMLAGFGMQPPALLGLVLPVGVSFFCFQAISYIVDVARGDAKAEPMPLKVLVYIFFFPHLAAGPIVRAAHFLPQLAQPPDPRRIPLLMAGMLIIGGLAKKVLVANTLATQLVDPVFGDPEAAGAADAALAVYGYAAQIYCDFSAYSDMAIGVAALLGYHFPRNFDQPYRAATLSDFWRRWHISLSRWLRDYLYIPLGGSRGGEARTARNLMLTMLLGGLWHGAAWRFLLWGALHGAGLVVERLLGWHGAAGGWRRVAGVLVTFHIICLGWVLFRAPDLATAWGVLAALGRMEGAGIATPALAALTALALALHVLPPGWTMALERRLANLPAPALGLGFGIAILGIVTLGPSGTAPFIYFQF
jgi:D-alanyl-lipoteichoic acid acyltransferase DltB (MBOAT superfamily)